MKKVKTWLRSIFKFKNREEQKEEELRLAGKRLASLGIDFEISSYLFADYPMFGIYSSTYKEHPEKKLINYAIRLNTRHSAFDNENVYIDAVCDYFVRLREYRLEKSLYSLPKS